MSLIRLPLKRAVIKGDERLKLNHLVLVIYKCSRLQMLEAKSN